jgi:hypothetical protein
VPTSLELVVDASASFARIRFEIVTRLTQNRPFFGFSHMCVKPKKSNVSGLPKPRFPRRSAAYRPNSISRGLSGWEFQPKLREPLTKLHKEPAPEPPWRSGPGS